MHVMLRDTYEEREVLQGSQLGAVDKSRCDELALYSPGKEYGRHGRLGRRSGRPGLPTRLTERSSAVVALS